MALATGDIELTGIGTLTYRRGNKIVAFGHPMLGIGAIDAPMTSAYVHDVFPSVLISSKIASAMEVKGRIFEDRPWSIGGEIGKLPTMIPIKVHVDDQVYKRRRTLNVNVINHPLIAPRLISLVTSEAIFQVHSTAGDAMARVKFEVDADKVGKIERENIFFDPASIDAVATEDLEKLLSLLSNNRFFSVDVKSVKLNVTITSNRSTATIEGALVEKSKYEPGETIDVGLVLRPYKREPITRHIQVPVPAYAPTGRYTLQIRGGGRPTGPQIMGGPPAGPGQPPEGLKMPAPTGGAPTADNVKQLVEKFLEQEKNNEIVAKLLFPTSALNVRGEKLSRLPAPLASVMKSTRTTGVRMEREEVKVVQKTEFVIAGEQTLQIAVERRNFAARKGTERAEAGSAGESPAGETSVTPEGSDSEGASGEFDGEEMLSAAAWVGASGVVPASRRSVAPSAPAPGPRAVGKPQPEAKEEPAASKPEAKKPEKPIGRRASVWRQGTFAEFTAGQFDGTAATSKDEVRLAPRVRKLVELDQTAIWSVVPDGAGGVYAGTGSDGEIVHISQDGKSSVVYRSEQIAVFSLLRQPDGTIYAGTSPNGIVFRIGPDGKAQEVLHAAEKHIVALALGAGGKIYAGTGDGAVIYEIVGNEGRKLAVLPDPELVCLTADSSGNLYAGTGPNGTVYKVSPDGRVSAVFDAAEQYASALAVDSSGNLYVGTSPKGMVYKVPTSGVPQAVLDKSPGAITALASTPSGIYVATDGQISFIGSDDRVFSVDTGNSRAQFVSLAAESSRWLFAGTANPAGLYGGSQACVAGTYDSPVHDAKLPARWGAISWNAAVPEGTRITLQTRSGNSAIPDETWSPWSREYTASSGETVNSPTARFIQYRASLFGNGDATPVLKSVSLAYLPANQAPKVTIAAPQPGARWSGKQTIRWAGNDPDNDTLIYDVYYSSDRGATWKALRSGVKSKAEENQTEQEGTKTPEAKSATPNPDPKRKSAPVDESKVADQLRSEVEANPNIPREAKDKILAEVPEVAKELAKDEVATDTREQEPPQQAEESKAEPSKETSYEWDTTKVPDGWYMIKVVASDRVSNGEGYLTAEKVSEPFVVANKPPRLILFAKSLAVQPDKSVLLSGYTYSKLAEIAGVQYRIDGGDWMAAAPDDGIFDSTAEQFTVRTLALEPGERTIEVKAVDAAGNAATASTKVKIP